MTSREQSRRDGRPPALRALCLASFAAFAAALAHCASFGPSAGDGDASDAALPDAASELSDGAAVDAGCTTFALAFDGAQYLEVDDDPDVEGTPPFTAELWIMTDSRAPIAQMDLLSHYSHPIAGWGLLLNDYKTPPSRRVQFRYYDPTSQNLTSEPIADGRWVHIAAVHELGPVARIYVDGVEVGTRTDFPDVAIDQPGVLRIGSGAGKNFRYMGLIDEVHLAREVLYTGNFERPKTPPEKRPSTLALYHFAEGTGTRTEDETGRHPARMPDTPTERPRWQSVPCIGER